MRVLRDALLMILVTAGRATFPGRVPDEGDIRHIYPSVSIAVGLHEHSHVLPYFLGWLEGIDYPKSRIHLELYLHGKEDSTYDQISWWKDSVSTLFATLKVIRDNDNWLEAGLRSARLRKINRILLIGGDTLPFRGDMIQILASNKSHVVVCPLFDPVLGSEATNIEEVDKDYASRTRIGREEFSFASLPMFINLELTDASYITFDPNNLAYYDGAEEPLEVFSDSAKRMNIKIWNDNNNKYGVYLNETMDVEEKRRMLRYHLADMIADKAVLPSSSRTVRPWTPEPKLWSVNKIYVINLKRRPKRKQVMAAIFELLGVDATWIEATDGQSLPSDYKLTPLPGYLDPFHKRPMKAGEIGCLLSHYRIWKDMVAKQIQRAIVFEDDLRFSESGLERIEEVLYDLDDSRKGWDLIYLGRKKQADQKEFWISGHRHLSSVGYSYWTLGYILNLSGAEKLLNAKPLEKMVPVDEYIPIMFNKHPNEEWSSHFEPRNLLAFTLHPLSVSPQRYTNEPGYVSDTEDSTIIELEPSNEQDLETEPAKGKSEL